jgi:hypothetical protein
MLEDEINLPAVFVENGGDVVMLVQNIAEDQAEKLARRL